MTCPPNVQSYLTKRGVDGPWQITPPQESFFRAAIVIPSLAEGALLTTTLESLAADHSALYDDVLVIVVLNQRADATASDRDQNRVDLKTLAEATGAYPSRLAWIDAASPGHEMPVKQGGVGLARKIGLDLALACLAWDRDPLLIWLDADTRVEPGYLAAIFDHYEQEDCGGAILAYCHQECHDPAQQAAIERYELFLRSYVLGLEVAGSPYAYTSIGSAITCRAHAYVRSGGMNRRQAAEDFYFLQQVAKTDGISLLNQTTVHPASRASHRVPFGTGRSIGRQLAGEDDVVTFYPVEPFRQLAGWLDEVTRDPDASAETLLSFAADLSPAFAGYLTDAGWGAAWQQIQENHHGRRERLAAFHRWFDGLRTMRLIHTLCDNGNPRGDVEAMVPELFAWAGLKTPATITEKLALLRQHRHQPVRINS